MSNNTIAISGIGRGIGRAIAEVFGTAGWRVYGAARTSTDLDAIAQYWKSQAYSGELQTTCADLATEAGCQHWAKAIAASTSELTVLVNNVGQFGPGTVLESEAGQLAQFLAANVLSAHYLSRALLPLLQANAEGQLLTIGSVATTDWPPPMANYAISKYALEGWHRALAQELAGGTVRCTLLRPGATYTSSWDGVDVDPATLLAPEQVAQLVWRCTTEERGVTEVTIRP